MQILLEIEKRYTDADAKFHKHEKIRIEQWVSGLPNCAVAKTVSSHEERAVEKEPQPVCRVAARHGAQQKARATLPKSASRWHGTRHAPANRSQVQTFEQGQEAPPKTRCK